MLTDWLILKRIRVEGAERLYPTGVDWKLNPGVNAIVGGTGLGKTTMVYAAQFGVFGKLVVDGDRIERDFFKDRLTKRKGAELAKFHPTVLVEFCAGGSDFVVKRDLITGGLLECICDGKKLKSNQLDEKIAECVGIPGDTAGIARLQEHLFFFGEGRYLLAWENLAQNELINLMMSDHASYARLTELWAEVESADSAARNISAQAHRFEADLALIVAEKPTDELARRSTTRRIQKGRQELEAELSVARGQLERESLEEAALAAKIATSYRNFHSQLSELESDESADADDALFAAALADPTIASVRRSLGNFYADPDGQVCPCCNRTGLGSAVSDLVPAALTVARAGGCVVCSKDLPRPASRLPHVAPAKAARTDARAGDLQQLIFKRQQTQARMVALRDELTQLSEQLTVLQTEEIEALRSNPVSMTNGLKVAVAEMRRKEQAARDKCEEHMAKLKRHLKKTDAVFSTISKGIARAFTKYATLYLDETCEVAFLEKDKVPQKRGPQVKAPHAAFFPVISDEVRPSSQALSDAQRSFVDLAFRMAVIEVWHKQTKKHVTMVVETPEGAVDIAYMERVATMLRTFGEQGHTLIITTNLNNDIFLPEVLAAAPKAGRMDRVVNLLQIGNPRPVQKKQQPRFDEIMKLVQAHTVR